MSRFEELYKSKRTFVPSDASFYLDQLNELRRKDGRIPKETNPICNLSEEEFEKLRWTATKNNNSLAFILYADAKEENKTHLLITVSGDTIYSTEKPKDNCTQKQLVKYIDHNYDVCFASEMNKYCNEPSNFFLKNNYGEALLTDLRDAGTEYAQTLKDNNFARYGFSSDNYRAMEDRISDFNKSLLHLTNGDLKDPETLKALRENLNVVVTTIKRYVDGKGGLNLDLDGTEYEKKRVRAAKDAYYKFAKLDKIVTAAEHSIRSNERYTSLKGDIVKRFKRISDDNPTLKRNVEAAQEGANAIVDVYKGYNHDLTNEEKQTVVESFNKLCELQYRRILVNNKDEKINALAYTLSSEEILNTIKASSEYIRLVGDPTKITAKTARELLEQKAEVKVASNYKDLISEKLGVDYLGAKQLPIGPAQ